MSEPVYLDWNATAPLRPAARAAWLAAQDAAWANPASVHAAGQRARHALDQAKSALAAQLGCHAHELVLTSGGTEANATALGGLTADDEVLASAIDHSSVLRNAERTASLRLLPVDGDGRLDPATVAAAIGPRTRVLALQFANNELGTLQGVPELVHAAKTAAKTAPSACMILLDACQGAGKATLDLHALGVDLASFAGHKFGAPKGVGLLYVRNGVRVPALFNGGKQQQDRRSGTEDAALASALAAALTDARADGDAEAARQRALLNDLWRDVHAALPQARWLAQGAPRLANTMNLAHPGVLNSALVMRLDLAGFAVSTGSACMAARGEPSHVIAALGLEPALARSAIRVSIGHTTTAAELAAFARAYVREVNALVAAPVPPRPLAAV